jgi:hypothetical protein
MGLKKQRKLRLELAELCRRGMSTKCYCAMKIQWINHGKEESKDRKSQHRRLNIAIVRKESKGELVNVALGMADALIEGGGFVGWLPGLSTKV